MEMIVEEDIGIAEKRQRVVTGLCGGGARREEKIKGAKRN
jgi:hypothetical protein